MFNPHQIIKARAPLRLGLAGGGTDISPYCDIYGGYVLNATIDRYAYAVIETLSEPVLKFNAFDHQVVEIKPLGEPLSLNGTLDLHKATYDYMITQFNHGIPIALKLSTFCDAPTGSGLGSSSTLVVAMVKAFMELLNLPLDDYRVAHIAFEIERKKCNLQGGRQDQYSATFGGFNFMEFYKEEKAIINSLRIKNWIINELESSLLLFFTGISRESATIIKDQSNNVSLGDLEAIKAMHGIKQEALVMKESLLRGNFEELIESMRGGWLHKKRSAKTVSNFYLDEIYEAAIKAGALAGKVSGAGGGGFMLFFTATENRMQVIQALKPFEGQINNCHFTKNGSQAWKVK